VFAIDFLYFAGFKPIGRVAFEPTFDRFFGGETIPISSVAVVVPADCLPVMPFRKLGFPTVAL
jgi:hypothetical protein